MNRKKKVVRNIVILTIIFSITFTKGLYLSPIAAHKSSERSIHYGPSKIVHVEDFDGGKYILGKYDKWISCNTINRFMFLFWTFGNQATGIDVDETKPLNSTWGYDDKRGKLYGIINDEDIVKIELLLNDGSTLVQTEFYDDDMFLFTWEGEFRLDSLRAYDSGGSLIFEDYRWR